MAKLRVVSLFASIGGIDLGFERAGHEVIACVEIDPNCRKLLADKFPTAIIHDDVTTAGAHNLPACDIVTFGFPCQDLSVAGKREGLAGKRSGLYYEAIRIIDELKPAFSLFENVPGLLSSDRGRDFARVPIQLAKLGYHGAWRVFDSQYLGVAQRRRRVFGLFTRLNFGAAGCGEVLSLPAGLQGYPPPSRETREGTTHGLETSAGRGRLTDVASTLDVKCKDGQVRNQTGYGVIAPCLRGSIGTASATDSRGQDCVIPEVQTTVRMVGFGDYVEDGASSTVKSRDWKDATDLVINTPDVMGTLDKQCGGGKLTTQGAHQGFYLPVIQTGHTNGNGSNVKQDGTSYTLESRSTQAVLTFDMSHADDPARDTGDTTNTLQARMGTGGNQVPCVCLNDQGGDRMNISKDISGTITHQMNGHQPAVVHKCRVRRLTERECERLQGFPDDWSDGFSSSVRYKMIGNAVTVNVSQWIAERLAMIIMDSEAQAEWPSPVVHS